MLPLSSFRLTMPLVEEGLKRVSYTSLPVPAGGPVDKKNLFPF